LLKPFSYEEFLRAAQKALNYAGLLNRPAAATAEVARTEAENDHIFLKVEYQLVRVALSDILYIESLKDYVKVWLEGKDKALLSLTSLKALEEKLPVNRFMRIHRSFIISLDKITSINKTAVYIGKTLITVGDQYKDAFAEFVSRWG